ncbi:FtsX-like permease family protein [uncultured Phycicoccus sp.]|uniref:FtsX-like permease family protein n=1 Tax=uncultured Phycicoccus sp. TaxID=661422 RepID=UPI00262A2D5C|nr:FtsX-like permease family protein [uncultured Phycicoccus sp.]
MSGARLLRRRLRTHPVAVAAIVVSVLMALVVVTALQLLAAAITEAGVRSTLDVPPASRSLVLAGSLKPGDLDPVDTAFRRAVQRLPDVTVTRVGTTTTRALPSGAATDRAFLADVAGIDTAADLTDGRWPVAPDDAAAAGDGTVEVALPQPAAEALGLAVGDELETADLVDEDAPPVTLELVGVFRPRSPQDALWVDLPLGLSGVTTTDFTTYGPFVLAPGTFDGPLVGSSAVTWRATPDLGVVGAAELRALGRDVDAAARDLRRATGLPEQAGAAGAAAPAGLALRGPRVTTSLPGLVDAAGLVGDRIRVSLLTPVLLLALLGAVALVGSAALLATLRDGETRLLRTRGASTARLAALAAGDACAVALLGVLGTLLLAPGVTRLAAGLPGPWWTPADAADPALWRALLPLVTLAVLVTVATTLWVGRAARGATTGAGRRRGARFAAGSGLDLLLVLLGALAAVQLRRYDTAGATTVDPLTAAAPALVVAGLAVVCLRLLPPVARWVSRAGVGRAGLDAAWGGWQFARRAASQGGTLLLVLLAVGMGTIALGHSATVGRAVEDQSAFEAGAPVRVVRGISGGDALGTGALATAVSGGPERVSPVWRSVVDLGGIDDVTVLGVDAATAGRVADPRPDTLGAATWQDLTGRLLQARDVGGGVELPGDPRELELTVRVEGAGSLQRFGVGFPASAHVRDSRGLVTSLPLGGLSATARTVSTDLTGRDLQPPLALVGVSVPVPGFVAFRAPEATMVLDVQAVFVDGVEVPTGGALAEASDQRGLWRAAAPAALDAVPVVLTREVADALQAGAGRSVVLPLGVRDLTVSVVGVVDSLPTAATPTRAVLLDLPTAMALPDRTEAGAVRSRAVFDPGEWWSAPPDPAAAAARLRADGAYGTVAVVRDELVADRRDDPVNAGMRSAMLLVTAASVVLAMVGFAASTAALGRARRHENAVLLALGMPTRRIRRVLAAERVLVVVVTVLVGLLLGVVAALVVVPLLVGGDGHAQVPSVRVVLPPLVLGGYVTVLLLCLSAVGALVLRASVHHLAGQLREGEPS